MVVAFNSFQENYLYKYKANPAKNISFTASKKEAKAPIPDNKVAPILLWPLPKILHPTPKEERPVNLPGVSYNLARRIVDEANSLGKTVDEYLKPYLAHLNYKPAIAPEPSTTTQVGKTNVTTLIDGSQIFNKITDYIKSAEKSIQIEMYELQNLKVDGDVWPSKGAEMVPGWEQQQAIVDMLIQKKKTNPDLKVQVILDSSKWGRDGFGLNKKYHNNQRMIKYLKDNGIDVVPYPRAHQGGTNIQHVKFLAVDSKKVVLGGMNWGNHSPANHDACLAIETNPKYKNSEVDNLIAEIFNKDWTFSWQRLGKTKFVLGPLNEGEQADYKGIRKEIKPESIEYMEIVGKIFDNPEHRNRYEEGKLDLPEVKPIKNPAMKILTNNPRDYSLIGDKGSESIGTYIKKKLDTTTSLKAELFVLSHKEIINKIIERYKEGERYKKAKLNNETNIKDRPFDVEIIVHPEIMDEYPYTRTAVHKLEEAGVPLRMYKIDESIHQKMHSKWAVFDEKELLIGSANWSVVGLENNLKTGKRPDYPLTNEMLDNKIYEYKPKIDKLEQKIGLKTLFKEDSKIDTKKLSRRKNALNSFLEKHKEKDTSSTIKIEGQEITLSNDETGQVLNNNISKLIGYYKLVQVHLDRKNKFKRGNHECAVVINNPKITSVFLKQFKKDWDYSITEVPDGYGANQENISSVAQLNFSGKKAKNIFATKEPSFVRLA